MDKTVGIGYQDFGDLLKENVFYIDKTYFIKEWWENRDVVTLITRPRRFGKTLTMSMLEYFFSNRYAGQGRIFEGLSIWGYEEYRKLQGGYPVLNLSFANVKGSDYQNVKEKIFQIITNLYSEKCFLKDEGVLDEKDREYFGRIAFDMKNSDAELSIYQLSKFLYQYYGKKVIILLDEYDTPMQEAYMGGYWEELVGLLRGLFHSAFKTNPYLERAVLTGITRISKESIFSDLNNLEVVTTTSDKYADVFGFTEKEVFMAMEEMGLQNQKKEVKEWYDGFNFGKEKDIYNPWSIINFLSKGKFAAYWANSSSNGLISKIIREGSTDIKEDFERLLQGEAIKSEVDEEITYSQLDDDDEAIWSLLLAGGYLKVLGVSGQEYELALTNHEVGLMFAKMAKGWFKKGHSDYNAFLKALLLGDLKAMNAYMNRVALNTFSYFDTGKNPSLAEPERFYHGFVLGLLVDLADRYVLTSNRESGFGRYDVLLEPFNKEEDGIIIEFKVHDPGDGGTLQDTVQSALKQIEEKGYGQELKKRGIPEGHIRKYGFAFEGKKVLIG
ncbi:MAG: AAA family ATPase [Lachnospiraceae bacterium]|nr:AAA family ATPase [Lachnospiraceae bacterium]